MHAFPTGTRSGLISRCGTSVALRAPPGGPEKELDHGLAVFLDRLIKPLIVEKSATPMRNRLVSDLRS